MAEYTAGFETGINGNTISTSDAGDATAWQSIAGAPNPTYSNTHVAFGALAAAYTVNGAFTRWASPNTWGTDHYGRFYLYATANPGSNQSICSLQDAGGTSNIVILTGGNIQSRDHGAGVNGSVSISLNQWVRIEYHFISSATVGLLEVKLFNTAASTTPDETIASTANRDTGATAITEEYFGQTNFGPWGATTWMDSILVNATSYPGPVVTGTQNLAAPLYTSGHGAC